LQDLFLILETNGYPLRKHLLDLSKQYLSKEAFSYFSYWIKQNAKNDTSHHCWQMGSVLSSGSCGGESLLNQEQSPEEEATSAYANILEEARACLDYGQLDVAQQLLEDELLKHPESKEIEQELLTIYQYSRDKDQFDILTNKLLEQGVTLSEKWKECQENSSIWGE
jgi:hypothetical protein